MVGHLLTVGQVVGPTSFRGVIYSVGSTDEPKVEVDVIRLCCAVPGYPVDVGPPSMVVHGARRAAYDAAAGPATTQSTTVGVPARTSATAFCSALRTSVAAETGPKPRTPNEFARAA